MEEESDFNSSEGKRHLPQEDFAISEVGSSDSSISKKNRKTERKQTSIVWRENHMTKDSKNVTCKYCKQTFSLSTSSGVLIKHLRKEHSEKVPNEDSEDEESLSGEPEKKRNISNTHLKISDFYKPSQKVDFNDYLVKWVVQTQKPWAVVEEPIFREMIIAALTLVNPSLKLPSAKQMAGFVDQRFTVHKEKLLNYFRNFPGKISLTLDGWTSITQEPFLGITGKFEFKIKYW